MSDNVNNKILLVGIGAMAIDYAKVLKALNVSFDAIGRSEAKAESFYHATGIRPNIGGVETFLERSTTTYSKAIVAVDITQLANVAIYLTEKNIPEILLEKPGGISVNEIQKIVEVSTQKQNKIFIAYNRRYYSSVIKLQELIEQDGPIRSFNFEFTEWGHVIEKLDKPTLIKENWFLANSTHVIDLAFFLGGDPVELSCYKSGKTSWHPNGSIYSGAGISAKGALFAYNANWEAPGRWGVEILTNKHRYILKPLEKLFIQHIGSVNIEEVHLDEGVESGFKPGLYAQVLDFIKSKNKNAIVLSEHLNQCLNIYNKINY